MDRYKIGSGDIIFDYGTLSRGRDSIEELQIITAKKGGYFYPQKNIKRRIFHFQISSTIITGHKMISKTRENKRKNQYHIRDEE